MAEFDPNLGFVSESADVAALRYEVAQVREDYDQAAAALLKLRTEDKGWEVLGQVQRNNGFSLKIIKDVAKKAEVQQVGNPLLKRAFELRFHPIFSRGFELEVEDGQKIKPRYQRKLDNISVQEVLFSEAGIEQLERTCFNVGNLFFAYNRLTGDALLIPFEEITNRAVDPDFPARTAYYQWSHTRTDFDGKTKRIVEWLPVVEWVRDGKDTEEWIANPKEPVNHDWTVVDMRVNVPTTGHWGIPDSFPALPYAWAYSEYIRDAASLLKALNTIAWRLVGKSKSQAQTAGIALAGARKTGGVAAMTAGTELTAMPKAGQVDMADGMALAAMVASATGVPTPALISVVQGGNAATIQSLDGPTVAMARQRQSRWADFYKRVFLAMGIEGVTINFPKITEDPIHRQVSSLATARTTGAIHADEYRDAILEALSIRPLHSDAPDAEEYAQAQNALQWLTLQHTIEVQDKALDNLQSDPLARQGNSPQQGKLGENDNTNRNADSKAGKGTQTDLVG